MAKKQQATPEIAMLNVFANGFEVLAGNVEQTDLGFSVSIRPSRKKYLEKTTVPYNVVLVAQTGEDGYVAYKSPSANVTSQDVDMASAEVDELGNVTYSTEAGDIVFVSAGLETSLYNEVSDAEESAPAPKKTAKKKPAPVVEEDDEDEDEEEEEPAPKKSRGKKKPAPVVEDDEDEDEDEDEEEEEEEPAPKKKAKSKTKKRPVEEDEDDEDEDDEDEDDDEDF